MCTSAYLSMCLVCGIRTRQQDTAGGVPSSVQISLELSFCGEVGERMNELLHLYVHIAVVFTGCNFPFFGRCCKSNLKGAVLRQRESTQSVVAVRPADSHSLLQQPTAVWNTFNFSQIIITGTNWKIPNHTHFNMATKDWTEFFMDLSRKNIQFSSKPYHRDKLENTQPYQLQQKIRQNFSWTNILWKVASHFSQHCMYIECFSGRNLTLDVYVLAGSLALIAVCAGTAITMVSKVSSWRQRFQAHAGSQTYKHSILEYVTGNYLAAQYCQVRMSWELKQVGYRCISHCILVRAPHTCFTPFWECERTEGKTLPGQFGCNALHTSTIPVRKWTQPCQVRVPVSGMPNCVLPRVLWLKKGTYLGSLAHAALIWEKRNLCWINMLRLVFRWGRWCNVFHLHLIK